MRSFVHVAAIAAAALLASCAAEIVRSPATLTPLRATSSQAPVLTTSAPVTVRASSAYERTIASGTRFEAVGDIDQGRVYRPLDTVLTVEGKHQHEAYLVVSGRRIVGFFLPVEGAFAPAANPTDLP